MNKFQLADSFRDNLFKIEETVLEMYKEDNVSEAERLFRCISLELRISVIKGWLT